MLILNVVLSKPGVYLKEIQEELSIQLMVDIDTATICRFLHKNGFTRQKLRIVALQRDAVLRQKYAQDISLYKPEMFIFLDETGTDQRDTVRRFGYSIRGVPMQKESLFGRRERVSDFTLWCP